MSRRSSLFDRLIERFCSYSLVLGAMPQQVWVHVFMRMRMSLHVSTDADMSAHMSVHMSVRTSLRVAVCVFISMPMCMSVRISIRMSVSIYHGAQLAIDEIEHSYGLRIYGSM